MSFARPVPSSPNPEWVLCNIPVSAPVVTSSCEVMPRLTGKSSAGSPVTLTECETEREIRHDVRETVAVDLDAKNDVDMAENTPQSEVVDMGGSDGDKEPEVDDKEPEVEFRYEKIGTYSFPPTIVELWKQRPLLQISSPCYSYDTPDLF